MIEENTGSSSTTCEYEYEDKEVASGTTSYTYLDDETTIYGYTMTASVGTTYKATITNLPNGYELIKDAQSNPIDSGEKLVTEDNNIENLNKSDYNISLTLKNTGNGKAEGDATTNPTTGATNNTATSTPVKVESTFTYTYTTGYTYNFEGSCYKQVPATNEDGSLKKDDAGKQVYDIELDCPHKHTSSCYVQVKVSERDHANCGDIGFDDRHVIHTPNVEGEKKTYGILERCHFFSLIFFSSKANACVDT
jgi:hypothetical protein